MNTNYSLLLRYIIYKLFTMSHSIFSLSIQPHQKLFFFYLNQLRIILTLTSHINLRIENIKILPLHLTCTHNIIRQHFRRDIFYLQNGYLLTNPNVIFLPTRCKVYLYCVIVSILFLFLYSFVFLGFKIKQLSRSKKTVFRTQH